MKMGVLLIGTLCIVCTRQQLFSWSRSYRMITNLDYVYSVSSYLKHIKVISALPQLSKGLHEESSSFWEPTVVFGLVRHYLVVRFVEDRQICHCERLPLALALFGSFSEDMPTQRLMKHIQNVLMNKKISNEFSYL